MQTNKLINKHSLPFQQEPLLGFEPCAGGLEAHITHKHKGHGHNKNLYEQSVHV